MSAGAARLLAPAIVVLLAAGIVAAAVVGSDDAAAPAATTTTAAASDDVQVATTASTSSTSTSTTSTTVGGSAGTTTAPPIGDAPTATTSPATSPPATQPTASTAPPGPADLIVHANDLPPTDTRPARIRFSVENAGPGAAPGIVLTLDGVPGASFEGDGVDCDGSRTLTCRVAATNTGGLLGFVEVAVADGCPEVTATVVSSVDDPDPESNSRTVGLCR